MQGYGLAHQALKQLQGGCNLGSSMSMEPPSTGNAAGIAASARRCLSADLDRSLEAAGSSAPAACNGLDGKWMGGKIDLLLVLGRGSFGRVYLGTYRGSRDDPKVQVAVKVRTLPL